MKRIYDFLGGRSLTFAWVTLALGTALAYVGKLTAEYVALLGALQVLVTTRAIGQDKVANGKG